MSLLALPLGTGTILDHLAERLDKVGHGEILVLSDYLQPEDPLFKRQGTLSMRRVTFETLAPSLERYEASDHLLVVDPRLWPTGGQDFEVCRRWTEMYRGATHLIAAGSNGEGAYERVERDREGNVRRVQRLYAKHWSEVSGSSIICSMVPLRSTIGLRFNFPMDLRSALAATGVLSQDVPLDCDAWRLGTEGGFLALTEHTVTTVCRQGEAEGYEEREHEILVGEGCQIARSARLVGPIIVQPGVEIEKGVTVIGPAVLGAGSRLRRGATIVQSVLTGGAAVEPGTTVRQQVVCRASQEQTEGDSIKLGEPNTAIPGVARHGNIDSLDWGMIRPERRRPVHCAIKRALDIFVSASAVVALSPLLVMVAVAVKLDSRGPVFFSQRREGRRGREFPCWKFRTMVADADQKQRHLYSINEVDGPQFKLRNDPRVTRVGRWLRSTNIDELPQLFNVLLGHMSLVGPRPSPFRENQICVPWRRARLSVTPGITGLWQVCRDEDRENDFHEWIFYDLAYVRHFSIWLDLKILLATMLTLGGRWSVRLSWFLPKVARVRDVLRYSVSAA